MSNFKSFISGLLMLAFLQSSAQETAAPVSIVHHLGVTALSITPAGENQRVIQLKAKPVIVNEQKLDLNGAGFEVTKKEQLLQIVQKTDDGAQQSLQFDGEKFVLTKDGIENEVTDDLIETFSPVDLNAFIVLANVLKEADVHFDDGEVVIDPPNKASIRDRWCDQVVISGGMGRTVSESRCVRASEAFLKSHKDCYKIGDCDTSCAYGDHACFSTALFGCTGPSCNGLIGIN